MREFFPDFRVRRLRPYDARMLWEPLRLTRPGLFVTGTDTGVGKTVIACAIAHAIRSHSQRVAVCKPMATGCRREREGLVSDDAEALAHFADCRLPLEIINPVRFHRPLAPAVAAAMAHQTIDYAAIRQSLARLDAEHDVLLIEGVGGLLVPIDPDDPKRTVLDLIQAIGYPVVVVARAGLGTLNHTGMTVRLLRQAGCRAAGLVVNGYEADSSGKLDAKDDLAMATNRRWLELTTGLRVLATVPRCPAAEIAPEKGVIPEAVLEAVGRCHWPSLVGSATASGSTSAVASGD